MNHRSILETLLQFLFPDRCAGCRRLGGLLCSGCQAALVPYSPDRRAPPPSLVHVHIAYVFQSPLREAIHQLKYRKNQRMAQTLGALMAQHIAAHTARYDAVAAIPLHAARMAERGFNQAEVLAREVAQTLGLPLLAGPLVRLRATAQQAQQIDATARAANMRDAFGWRGGPPPARLLLVDDVYTTGATMGACAAALLGAGAQAVEGLALARSRLDS